jgi:hypothetical protein
MEETRTRHGTDLYFALNPIGAFLGEFLLRELISERQSLFG